MLFLLEWVFLEFAKQKADKYQFSYIQNQGYVDNGAYINYTINENKATDRRLVLKNIV